MEYRRDSWDTDRRQERDLLVYACFGVRTIRQEGRHNKFPELIYIVLAQASLLATARIPRVPPLPTKPESPPENHMGPCNKQHLKVSFSIPRNLKIVEKKTYSDLKHLKPAIPHLIKLIADKVAVRHNLDSIHNSPYPPSPPPNKFSKHQIAAPTQATTA